MDGYNIFGLIAILGCTLIGLYMLIAPQKYVKKENDSEDLSKKVTKARVIGGLLTVLGIVGIILIIAL